MRRILRSMRYAVRGIVFALRNERNFQIELAVGGAATLLLSWLPLSTPERAIIVLLIVTVLAFELVNTGIERVMDILKPRVHPYAKVVKDTVAGAVLLVSLGAVVIGVLIFAPYFFR